MTISVVKFYAGLYVAVAFLSFAALQAVPVAYAANCNTACTEGYVTVTAIFGGIECNHGPDNNDACKALPSYPDIDPDTECWELNGHMGTCKCFECGKKAGCEEDLRNWRASCGKKSEENDGICNIVDNGGNGVIRQHRAASTPGGAACDFGQNGFVLIEYCGGSVPNMAGACRSTNCTGSGNWTTDESGDQDLCAPVP